MRLVYVFLAFLCIIALYVIIPVGGGYGTNDVSINPISSTAKFPSPTENIVNWYELVKINNKSRDSELLYNGTDCGYIVHPATGIPRNGNKNGTATLKLMSGQIRGDGFQSGNIHGALDSVVDDYEDINSCPAGRYECSDISLISPVTGEIIFVSNTVGNYESSYDTSGYGMPTAYISIKAEGSFKGYVVRIFHLSNIPDYIQVGYKIQQGEFIGSQCAQGQSTGSHVHMDVQQGDIRVSVDNWINNLVLHRSITSMIDSTPTAASLSLQGWTDEIIASINSSKRFNNEVIIPNELKVGA